MNQYYTIAHLKTVKQQNIVDELCSSCFLKDVDDHRDREGGSGLEGVA